MTNEIDATRMPVVRLTNTGEAMADSRDVAAYFDRRHDAVLRDIRNLVDKEPDLGLHNFVETPYVDAQNGQTYKCYAMDRRGFSILAMGFSGAKALKWKLRYLDAFDAMEGELRRQKSSAPLVPALPDFTNPAVAARAWAEQFEGREVAERQVQSLAAVNKDMEADVAALDRIAKADGSLNITESAKALQMKPKSLFAYLSAHGWIYRRHGSDHWLGYQTRVQSGDLEHKVTTILRADGTEVVSEQVRITPKGLAKLAKLFPSAVAAA